MYALRVLKPGCMWQSMHGTHIAQVDLWQSTFLQV